MDLNPKEQAQLQAEVAMTGFIAWTKRITLYFAIFLCIVVFACNNGVETGEGKTGSQYNGEQYNPSNLNVKKK
tara:strand:+ start:172 stop:390 length:219 start_codon:yes stop_codon:yes gene_type:complete